MRPGDDGRSGRRTAVEFVVGVVVGTQSGTFQGNSGENAAGARVAENFGAHVGVGVRGSGTALGSASDGSVGAELDLAMKQAACRAIVHQKKNEVSGFAANLEADAAAFESVHGRSAPRTGEILASAADHGATTVTAADDKGGFEDGRHDDDTAGLVQKILRNVVGNVEDFLHDFAGVSKRSCSSFALRGCANEREEKKSNPAAMMLEQRAYVISCASMRELICLFQSIPSELGGFSKILYGSRG